ncbi:MAG TPA: 6-bladed beta-propeller, partial [Candidatus Aminicenantes bacterium]|nr:6-bladed beta-propeller [Candidatus Aminicenantes bacterium]
MMRKYRGALCVLLFVFLAFSFSLSQEIETKDGVKFIHNTEKSLKKNMAHISLELVNTLGDINTADENLAFYLPEDIVVDSKGNVYILDAGNHRIQKFTSDYQYLATIGRQGQGPGEFYLPSSLDIGPDDYLYVSDPQNKRIQILKPDGTEYKTIKFLNESVGSIKLLDSGNIIMNPTGVLMMIAFSQEKELPKLIKVFDTEGNLINEFGEQLDFKNILMNRMGNQYEFAVDEDDCIYVTFLHQNRIEKYSPKGELLWRADRTLNYSMDPPKNKGKMEAKGGNRMIQLPQMNKCSEGVAVDHKGRVWIITMTRQLKDDEKVSKSVSVMRTDRERSMSVKLEGNTEQTKTDAYEIEIYSPEGILIQRIPLDHFVNKIQILKDRVFLLDKERGTKYYEYKIIEN